MVPVIYTTYGTAMGHRSEVLAASGGVRPAGGERRPKPSAQIGVIRVCLWLCTVSARMRLRLQDVYSRTADANAISASAPPSSRRDSGTRVQCHYLRHRSWNSQT
jgi:hypothetical protein